MTVILVLFTFLVFAIIDYVLHKTPAVAGAPAVEPEPAAEPDYVGGFFAPQTVRYHAGHGWLMRERPNLARVGMDDFAATIAGKLDKIELPKPGQWIRQGQQAWSLFRQGEKVEMVSPIEGEVVAVNAEALQNPSLVRNDPYGKGWLIKVHVPDEESTTRNLMPQGMVRRWMSEVAEQFYGLQPQLAGAVSADGGLTVEDPLAELPHISWKETASEFFLTGSGSEIAQS